MTDQISAPTPDELDVLRGDVAALEAERNGYREALLRERAEFINFRRRTEEEQARAKGLAADALLLKVVALADDFALASAGRPSELAGDAWAAGIAAIERKLTAVLESEGVVAVESAPGTLFDPALHEAIGTVASAEHPSGTIVAEIRRGYIVRDRVLRPALVSVAA